MRARLKSALRISGSVTTSLVLGAALMVVVVFSAKALDSVLPKPLFQSMGVVIQLIWVFMAETGHQR